MSGAKPGEDPKRKDAPAPNAVDGLTPPTMKNPPPPTDATQIGKPGDNPSRAGRTPQTLMGERSGETLVSYVNLQDLSSERLLRDASRIEVNGQQCPSLNKIPLLAKIGQGGMGAVYYGVHPRLRSAVAVKVLPFHLAEQDPGMIRRFYREAQIAAAVHSPHLVNVMDVNEESGLFFLVMEYVHGKTAGQILKAHLEQGQPGFSETEALDICIAACEGLNAAHQQGIVHRDLKPENIMVPYQGKAEKKFDLNRAKLMDLGLARSEDSAGQSLTGVQAAMGTPGYMAPEQGLDAKTADKRSDVWGMGATLYALLVGRAPFRGDAVMRVLMATMHEPHVPVNQIRPEVSATLSEMVDKCLEKKQENRYQDATQLLRALKNCRKLLSKGGESQDELDGVDVPPMTIGQRGIARTLVTAGTGTEATLVGPQGGAPVSVSAPKLSGVGGADGTLVGPQATGPSAPALAVPRKQTGLLIGATVAVVLLGGGLAFGLGLFGRRGPALPAVNNTATAVKNEKVLRYLREEHGKLIAKADQSLKDGQVEDAVSYLEVARQSNKGIQDLIDAESALDKRIELARKKSTFLESLAHVDGLIKTQKLPEAAGALLQAKADVPDAECGKLLEEKKTVVDFLQLMSVRRQSFNKELSALTETPDAKIDAGAKAKLETLAKRLPSDGEVDRLVSLSASWLLPDKEALLTQQKRFATALKRNADEENYTALLGRARAERDAQKRLDLIEEALRIFDDRKDANDLLSETKNNLEKQALQDREKIRQEMLKKNFDAAYRAAEAARDNHDPDGALAEVRRALSFIKDEPRGKRLAEELESAVAKRENERRFAALVDEANKLLDGNADLTLVQEKLASAEAIYKDRKELAEARQRVSKAQTAAKLAADYIEYSKKARDARTAKNPAEAQKYYDLALGIDPTGKGLNVVKDYLQEERKKEQERRSKKDNYDRLMAEAARFEEAGDKRESNAARLADYDNALTGYSQAQDFAEDRSLPQQKHDALLKRRTQVKTQVDEEQRRLAQAAADKHTRGQYQMKLAQADTLMTENKLAESLQEYKTAKALLTDKDKFQNELAEISSKIETCTAAINKAKINQARESYKTAVDVGDGLLKNNPQEALKKYQAAQTLLLADAMTFAPELIQIKAKLEACNKVLDEARLAQTRQALAQARSAVAAKIKERNFRAAVQEAENAGRANAAVRTDLQSLTSCLSSLQKIDDVLADARPRFAAAEKKLKKDKGQKEKEQLTALMDALDKTVLAAIQKLSLPESPDAAGLAGSLPAETARTGELTRLLEAFEKLSKQKISDDDPPLDFHKEKPKDVTPPKRKERFVPAGEGAPDD